MEKEEGISHNLTLHYLGCGEPYFETKIKAIICGLRDLSYEHLVVDEVSDKIEFIQTIVNSQGLYQVRFESGSAIWSHDKSFQFVLEGETHAIEEIIDKDEFLEAFENLHIGEWKRHYYFPCLDGEQWELTVEYGSPKDRFVVDGSNGYPYNFDEFVFLLRADIYEEE